MSDVIWPAHTPVKHKTEGWSGWIHATTRMKEIFTSNMDLPWQYTVRLEGEGQMKVAPLEDLEWIQVNAPFPAYVMYKDSISEKNYLEETRLHALGYQITGLNFEERWEILHYIAIPMLGAKEVIRTIMAVISSRLAKPANAEKFRFAFKEWNRDLNAIAEHHASDEDAASLRSTIGYIQRKLVDASMINAKEANCVG